MPFIIPLTVNLLQYPRISKHVRTKHYLCVAVFVSLILVPLLHYLDAMCECKVHPVLAIRV